MGFTAMSRHRWTNFLKKACLNTEENHRYILNALLNSTIRTALTEEQLSCPQNSLLAFNKYTQKLSGRKSMP